MDDQKARRSMTQALTAMAGLWFMLNLMKLMFGPMLEGLLGRRITGSDWPVLLRQLAQLAEAEAQR